MKPTDVTLAVALPEDLARAADQAEQESPGFLANALHYALMRRGIYHRLREQTNPEGGARA